MFSQYFYVEGFVPFHIIKDKMTYQLLITFSDKKKTEQSHLPTFHNDTLILILQISLTFVKNICEMCQASLILQLLNGREFIIIQLCK